jgi:hypothetical protein
MEGLLGFFLIFDDFFSISELGKRRWFAKDLWALDEDLLRRNKQVTF